VATDQKTGLPPGTQIFDQLVKKTQKAQTPRNADVASTKLIYY